MFIKKVLFIRLEYFIFFLVWRMVEIFLFVWEKDLFNKMLSYEYCIDKFMNYVKIEVGFIKFLFL